MKVGTFPSYCGGRILIGLTTNLYTDGRYYQLPAHPLVTASEGEQETNSPGLIEGKYRWGTTKTEGNLTIGSPLADKTKDVVESELRRAILSNHHAGLLVSRFTVDRKKDIEIPHLARMWNCPWGGPISDAFPGIPNVLEDFQYLLYHCLHLSGDYAFVHAVTNQNQTEAAGFLEKTGFTVTGKGAKNHYSNVCTNWIGDRTKIGPILEKQMRRFDDHIA